MHTNDVGALIEAGIDAGDHGAFASPASSTRSRKSSGCGSRRKRAQRTRPRRARDRGGPCTTAVVAVGVGEVQRLLNSLGVQAVVAGGQSMNPSTAQILEAVERCPADSVIVLPNNKNIVPVAEQVHALTARRAWRWCPRRRSIGAGSARGGKPANTVDTNAGSRDDRSRAAARAHRGGHPGRRDGG